MPFTMKIMKLDQAYRARQQIFETSMSGVCKDYDDFFSCYKILESDPTQDLDEIFTLNSLEDSGKKRMERSDFRKRDEYSQYLRAYIFQLDFFSNIETNFNCAGVCVSSKNFISRNQVPS